MDKCFFCKAEGTLILQCQSCHAFQNKKTVEIFRKIAALKSQLSEAKDMQSMDEQSLAEARKLLELWRKFGRAYKMNTPPGKEYQELFEAGELDTSNTDAYQEWCSVHGREG